MKDRYGYIVLWAIISALIIIGLWVFTYYDLREMNPDERGTFGDMFGGVNALFSGLALAGIIITILLQREDLNAQREELKLNRLEFEEQNRTFKLQRFENTFFSLLKFRADYLGQMTDQYYEALNIRGIKFISEVVKDIDSLIEKQTMKGTVNYKAAYCSEYPKHQEVLIPYYSRTLSILQLVEDMKAEDYIDRLKNEKDKDYKTRVDALKKQYVAFLLNELSIDELKLLAYETLGQGHVYNFKTYFETYSMLSVFRDNEIKNFINRTEAALSAKAFQRDGN